MRALTISLIAAALNAAPAPIFQFHTDELWLNLHHFLYVLGRAEAKTSDASREAVVKAPGDAERGLAPMSASERAVWSNAVSFYSKGLSTKDLIFDDSLAALTRTLAVAGDARQLGRTIDPAVRAALESAAPI